MPLLFLGWGFGLYSALLSKVVEGSPSTEDEEDLEAVEFERSWVGIDEIGD